MKSFKNFGGWNTLRGVLSYWVRDKPLQTQSTCCILSSTPYSNMMLSIFNSISSHFPLLHFSEASESLFSFSPPPLRTPNLTVLKTVLKWSLFLSSFLFSLSSDLTRRGFISDFGECYLFSRMGVHAEMWTNILNSSRNPGKLNICIVTQRLGKSDNHHTHTLHEFHLRYLAGIKVFFPSF